MPPCNMIKLLPYGCARLGALSFIFVNNSVLYGAKYVVKNKWGGEKL